jgi:hypothetical protein
MTSPDYRELGGYHRISAALSEQSKQRATETNDELCARILRNHYERQAQQDKPQ